MVRFLGTGKPSFILVAALAGACSPVFDLTSGGGDPHVTAPVDDAPSTSDDNAPVIVENSNSTASTPPPEAIIYPPLPPGAALSPQYLGMELSYFLPSSNTAMFLQHLGINQTRVFVSVAADFTGASFGTDKNGHAVTSADEFVAATAALSSIANPYKLSDSLLFSLVETQRMHINFLAQMHVDSAVFDFSTYDKTKPAYWQEHFGYYSYMYFFARLLLAQRVTYFETHNEPDIELSSVQGAIDRVLLTSQAVRAAAGDDPNRPQVKILGPVLVRTGVPLSSSYLSSMLDNMYTTIPAGQNHVPAIDLLAYHRYGLDGDFFANLATAYTGALSSRGYKMPLAVTEYSTSTSQGLDGSSASSDDARYAANFIDQSLGMFGKVPFINAFTYGMRVAPTYRCGIAKNGVHWVDIGASGLHNTGGATRSGEAFALLARHFGGSKPLYALPAAPKWATTADADHVYILAVNNTSAAVTTNASLAALPNALNVTANSPCFIDGVGATSYGQMVSNTALDANRNLSLTVPAYSTWLVTVPRAHSNASLTDVALQSDNLLKAGSDAPMMQQKTLRVAASSLAVNDTSAAVLQFAPMAQPASWVGLHLTVAASDASNVLLHVYGFRRTGTDANLLTWANSNIMQKVDQNTHITSIADNLLNYQDLPSPSFLGTLFVPAKSENTTIDLNVTDFANDDVGGGGQGVYVIVREFLSNGTLNLQPGPDVLADSAVTFFGGGANDAQQRPMLKVLAR